MPEQQAPVANPPEPPPAPVTNPPTALPAAEVGTPKRTVLVRTVLFFLFVLLLLTAVGALAYRYFRQQAKPTSYEECTMAKGSVIQESYPATCITKSGQRFVQPLSDEQKARLRPPTTSQAPNGDLSNWKTYRNEEYGLSIKHPPDWTFKQVSWEGGPSETSVDYDGVVLKPPRSKRGNTWINVYSVRNKGLSIRDYFNENDYSCCGINVEPTFLGDQIMSSPIIMVDGIEGRKLTNAPEDIPIAGVTASWVIVEKNSKIYLLSYANDVEEIFNVEEIFDQILSTFKFLPEDCPESCPQLMPPQPDFCQDGTVIPGGTNECGCQLPPVCDK